MRADAGIVKATGRGFRDDAMSEHSLSVVVPVYNSARLLPELLARLEGALARRPSPFEVILVDDGSGDESWTVIEGLRAQRPWLTSVHLMRNYGQHNALLCGIRRARHDVVVTMDDDLQHPPEECERLLAKLDEGYDVVYGTPQAERHGFWRDLSSRLAKLALRGSMGAAAARKVSAFRAFRRYLCESFADYQGQFVSIDVLLTWGTTRFAAVSVRHDERKVGASNYTFRQLLTHAMNMVTGFSSFPLHVVSLVGFAFTLFGAVVLVFVIGRYLFQGTQVPGFPFLASVIAIFSGAQLFAMGIIGEYLARIHSRMMGRPTYTVRATTGDSER
jgi:glycosyltransferase involved in cell wall biosynthesis